MIPTSSERPRRRLLRAGSLLTAAALALPLAACGSDGDSTDKAASNGPWTFTDDRGKTITLDKRPERIVAQVHAAASLWDFGTESVGLFGPSKKPDGTPDPQAGNVDLTRVTSIGQAFGEFNLEQFAALKPDLVVTIMYGPALWYVPEESLAKIEQIAPVVGIRLDGVSADAAIKRFGELAESLGADLDSDRVQDAKAKFEEASQKVRDAAKDKQGLKVQVAIGQEQGFWVADPKWHGDVKYLSSLGVDIVAPAKPDPAFGFEMLSWELASRYPADVVLEDARTLGMTPAQLAAKYPTWKLLPAVKAGQVGNWRAETPSSYLLYAPMLEELAETIQKSRTDVVS